MNKAISTAATMLRSGATRTSMRRDEVGSCIDEPSPKYLSRYVSILDIFWLECGLCAPGRRRGSSCIYKIVR